MESIDDNIHGNKIDYTNMSERQAILYLEKRGNDLIDQTNSETKNVILDYHKYFLFKKKQKELSHPKEVIEERNKLLLLSQKEYKPIKKNIYIDRKKNFYDEEENQCNCHPKLFTQKEANEIIQNQYKNKTENELFGCGRYCLNKCIFYECDERCPCGVSCQNKKFQNHEYADVYPIKTENRGWGLCAGSFIPKDTFIMQYIGEIYSLDSDYGKKKMNEYKNKTCTYLMGLPNNRNEVIDPTKQGNMARFINHSCDPNCETKKCNVKGELCIGIFTKKDVKENEELTFNYDFDLCKTPYQKCLCGSANCRGYLGISTDENKKKSNKILNCEICKLHCKHNETIIDCKICGKFFHKKCAKKRGQLSSNDDYKCAHCIKKGITKKNDDIKEKIRIDEEPEYDEYYEVGDEELQKIKKNLDDLINLGACLFWDYQNENAILGTSNKLDLKITGTTKQIENVKAAIKKLKLQKEENTKEFSIKLTVPKIYIRKIIGHQNRNLDSYKSKFGVQISFDNACITDEIFNLQEITYIQIKGKESNVKAVSLNIRKYLYNLKVISIYLLQEDYTYLRQNICSLKTSVDPADLRLRKFDLKNEREIKHPFYYISNNVKDLVIIGFENEIEKAQTIIKNAILRQNNLAFNYSLSFLFPIYFKKNLTKFIDNKNTYIKTNKLRVESIEPEYLRRHICVTISGKWANIIELKNQLWNFLKPLAIEGVPKKHDINEFEQYAYNQEHKLISKSIKTYIIEQNPQIKNWDYISEDIEYLQEKYFENNKIFSVNNKLQNKQNNDISSINELQENKKREIDVIENFINTSDKETRVNYLLNMRPGAYKTVFKMTQNMLFDDIIGVLEEVNESYKESKSVKENASVNSESKHNYSFKDNEECPKSKNLKNNLDDQFLQPKKIHSNIFNSENEEGEKSKKEDFSNNTSSDDAKKFVGSSNVNPISNLEDAEQKNNYVSSLLSQNIIINKNNNYNTRNNNILNNNTFNSLSNKNLPETKNSENTTMKSTNKSYNTTQKNTNYSNSYYNKNDEINNTVSSFLLRKTNRENNSKSSSNSRKEENYHHKKDFNKNYDYENRHYTKYYDHGKNSPYKERISNYYDETGYTGNSTNDYSMKYNDRDRDKERENYRNERQRSNSGGRYKDYTKRNSGYYGRDFNSYNINDSKNFSRHHKDLNYDKNNYKDYNRNNYNHLNNSNRDYGENNYSRNYGNEYNNNNDRDVSNNNRYASSNNSGYNRATNSKHYDNSNAYYNRKRIYEDNKFSDKRKNELVKGNSTFNYASGNKYSERSSGIFRSRQDRSNSRRRRSRSRNKSKSHSTIKRSHSNSNHKINNNFE